MEYGFWTASFSDTYLIEWTLKYLGILINFTCSIYVWPWAENEAIGHDSYYGYIVRKGSTRANRLIWSKNYIELKWCLAKKVYWTEHVQKREADKKCMMPLTFFRASKLTTSQPKGSERRRRFGDFLKNVKPTREMQDNF